MENTHRMNNMNAMKQVRAANNFLLLGNNRLAASGGTGGIASSHRNNRDRRNNNHHHNKTDNGDDGDLLSKQAKDLIVAAAASLLLSRSTSIGSATGIATNNCGQHNCNNCSSLAENILQSAAAQTVVNRIGINRINE
jgi:hypothetical protein